MTKLTRRGFIGKTSIGVATVGVVGGVLMGAPHLAVHAASPDTSTTDLPAVSSSEPMALYVRDFATGEVGLMVGEREIVYRDTNLVKSLMKAAK
ncbi:MAG: twin-arginine translocation signal domain-containing protein [Chloroflexota bacterium]|nr:twin-arginine translocation signal domain-containing protein [Chloroflexota bacterium]